MLSIISSLNKNKYYINKQSDSSNSLLFVINNVTWSDFFSLQTGCKWTMHMVISKASTVNISRFCTGCIWVFLKLKLSWQIFQICLLFLPNLRNMANLPNFPNFVKIKNILNISKLKIEKFISFWNVLNLN